MEKFNKEDVLLNDSTTDSRLVYKSNSFQVNIHNLIFLFNLI